MSNLIGTTVMCPECGAWNVPGHSCRDKNPFQDIANALAREIRETDALKVRLVEASKRIKELEDSKRVWQESAERMLENAARYREALELAEVRFLRLSLGTTGNTPRDEFASAAAHDIDLLLNPE